MADNRPPLPALTGLRCIAAYAIVLKHSGSLILKIDGFDGLTKNYDTAAVFGMSLFFILSGFIIHYNYGLSISKLSFSSIYSFFVARIARLYPLFIFLLVFDFACGNFFLLASPEKRDVYLGMLPYYVTLVQSWFLFSVDGVNVSTPYNYSVISWSISTEAFFYITYIFIAFWLVRVKNIKALQFFILAIPILYTPFVTVLRIDPPAIDKLIAPIIGFGQDPSFASWFWYISPYGRFAEFFVGCLLAQLYILTVNQEVKTPNHLKAYLILGFIIIFFGLKFFYQLTWETFLGPYIYFSPYTLGNVILIFMVLNYKNNIVLFLNRPFVIMLGEASYSTYMIHLVVVTALMFVSTLEPTIPNIFLLTLRLLFLFVLVALISIASLILIERPARKWVRKSLMRFQPGRAG